jgi:hypothetical protein
MSDQFDRRGKASRVDWYLNQLAKLCFEACIEPLQILPAFDVNYRKSKRSVIPAPLDYNYPVMNVHAPEIE